MNRSIKRGALLLTLGLIAGCDSYLNENPDNRVELNTLEKASQLLTNAYSSAGYNFTEWMTDNVVFTTGVSKNTEHNQAYAWQDVISINQDTPTNFWFSTYDAIAHSNEVLAVADNLPGDRTFRNAVKAEAYLTRAYGHFMLVNLFAKHYNDETSRTDPGIPYVTEPEREFIKQYERQSVRQVYDKIEDDIENGLRYVSDSFYANSGKYHFTKNAALAFASRFYLFKGDYEKCIEYSSEMLGDNPANFVKDIFGILDDTANPFEFLSAVTSPDETGNLMLVRQVTNFHVNVGYWPSPSLGEAIFQNNPWGADDVRGNTVYGYPIFLRGSGWYFGKYEFLFERSSLTSNVGFNYMVMPVFRGEEVLLNRAESYVESNQLTLALADLQTLIRFRYEGNPAVTQTLLRNYYQTTNSQTAIRSFIISERRKEFIHEGLRWFDIKRFGFPVTHNLDNVPGGNTISLDADDRRKVLQIPQSAIDVGGLEPNPR